MQTQEVSDELRGRTIGGAIEFSCMENNEAFLLKAVCENLGTFSVRVNFEGIEEAKRAASVHRTPRIVLDAAGQQPAFLFLDETTLVACEVLA